LNTNYDIIYKTSKLINQEPEYDYWLVPMSYTDAILIVIDSRDTLSVGDGYDFNDLFRLITLSIPA